MGDQLEDNKSTSKSVGSDYGFIDGYLCDARFGRTNKEHEEELRRYLFPTDEDKFKGCAKSITNKIQEMRSLYKSLEGSLKEDLRPLMDKAEETEKLMQNIISLLE